jgi:hypothetical protein
MEYPTIRPVGAFTAIQGRFGSMRADGHRRNGFWIQETYGTDNSACRFNVFTRFLCIIPLIGGRSSARVETRIGFSAVTVHGGMDDFGASLHIEVSNSLD